MRPDSRAAGRSSQCVHDGVIVTGANWEFGTSVRLGARVGGIKHFQQMRAINLSIDLRGRQAGMAKQILNGAQIRALGQ